MTAVLVGKLLTRDPACSHTGSCSAYTGASSLDLKRTLPPQYPGWQSNATTKKLLTLTFALTKDTSKTPDSLAHTGLEKSDSILPANCGLQN
jgi:hypothetical protein